MILRIHRIWPTRDYWWQKLRYPRRNVPLTEVGETQEQGFPWREGKCRVFRIPFSTHAIAIGKWTGRQSHENVDGSPVLNFRVLDHPEDYFHVQENTPD